MTSTFDDIKWARNVNDMMTMINEKNDHYSYIASFFPAIYWLDLLYMEMWMADEIKALKDLSEERKRFYWERSKGQDKKWMRILCCRAFLAYDEINEQDVANSNAASIIGEAGNGP